MNVTLGVAGDRHYSDYSFFSKTLQDHLERYRASHIITGDCTGTDTMAYEWALANGMPYTIYCASRYNWLRLTRDGASAVLCSDWRRDGELAGPKRNERLVRDVDAVLLFDGGGPGSKSVRKLAETAGRPLEVWVITPTGSRVVPVTEAGYVGHI